MADELTYEEKYERNRALMQSFADKFDPPLNVTPTANADGTPQPLTFMAATWDAVRGIGVTGVVYPDGQFKAFIEATGRGEAIAAIGELMAAAISDK